MAKLSVLAGATSQSVNVWIQDSSSTTGAGLSGLVFNSSGLIAYYTFAGANASSVQITLATLAAVNSAYSSGGFKEIDATNMKGLYRLDLPNAAIAAAKGRSVTIILGGATNMAPCVLEVELTGWDNQDAVHGGMSALPNAVAGAAGGLLISGSNAGPTTFGALTVTGATTLTGAITASNVGNAITGVTAALTGDFSATMKTSLNAATPASVQNIAAQTGDSYALANGTSGFVAIKGEVDTILSDVNTGNGALWNRIGAPAGASIAADIAAVESNAAAIKAKTDSLTFSIPGYLDVNIAFVNGDQITGNGRPGTEWGPA